MRKITQYNLFNCLLALAVVFAPVQSAVSAIDMLTQDNQPAQHCQHDMTSQMDQQNMERGSCCQSGDGCQDNCSSCTQCVSVNAMMILDNLFSETKFHHSFSKLKTSQLFGLNPSGEFRPPRFFS